MGRRYAFAYDEAEPKATAGRTMSMRELPERRNPRLQPHARAFIRDLDPQGGA